MIGWFVNDKLQNMWMIFGPKEDGPWRKLHDDELRSLYSSPNVIRGLNQGG
jgi:hypothetical protein